MDLQAGSRVSFYEGNTVRRGTVQAVETVEAMQVAVIKVDGTGETVKMPINALARG
ncbi:hypothetical protein FOMPIDRAFT_83841 [Fomitopsis schrenkii]|uniref:Hypervirulence associated protein TUDOR domain-containing protein n=1 Tax=Fomitopsis schrenkii TaxID=2126942 RepID=S8ET57_FOMSC|nr:hypothetical protein FOMPIDRAFT_83841 [Fomitopsis schrenkii]